MVYCYIAEPDLRILDEDSIGHQDEIYLPAGFPTEGTGGSDGGTGHGGEEGGEGESEDEGWYSLSRTDVRWVT